jgi:hypothetical protein
LRLSAAIYGLRGKQDVSIYILYPYGRVSPIQEQQMATVPDENVHCVAVDGTFDDCQVSSHALPLSHVIPDLQLIYDRLNRQRLVGHGQDALFRR